MKILVLGAGVIGTTYAWQLSRAGADVTLWVRPERKAAIEKNGLSINCIDLRVGRKAVDTIYCPPVIDDLAPGHAFELILVSVSADRLEQVLELLEKKAGQADIVFFQNTWAGLETFDRYLDPGQYFFGYPFKAGGGRDENQLRTVIFNHPLTATVLGEIDGKFTPRLKRAAHWLEAAGMSPKHSRQIIPYLWTHYAWAAATIGAVLKAGSYPAFVKNPRLVRESYLAMRECFAVCRRRGAEVRKVFPNNLFDLLPLPLLVPYTQRTYNTPEMQRMFEGHIQHAPAEMKRMYRDVLETGLAYGLAMPNYMGYQPFVDNTAAK